MFKAYEKVKKVVSYESVLKERAITTSRVNTGSLFSSLFRENNDNLMQIDNNYILIVILRMN